MASDYDTKFEEMKKYIPFLESMIRRLKSTVAESGNPRQAQLSKIKALRDLLLDEKKRMKMENLLKCEQVLINLYSKVEQRDTLPGIEPCSSSKPSQKSTPIVKHDLDTVRRKLKAVASNLEDQKETLPEIARANQTEVDCSPGSKEPALFQRRPHKPSSVNRSPNTDNSICKRGYTRVLVSPDSGHRHWTESEDLPKSNADLFHRRSPPKSPSYHKRDRKKSSKQESRSRKSDQNKSNLNITLKVPQESLNSLNTKDIFDRIISCDNSDVDIGTLREIRSQILSELKQTGSNEDISDIILKSYRNKKKKRTYKKAEIEEGELSDSESEAIENIYGSLVVVNGDKSTADAIVTEENTKNNLQQSNESHKIQICLVISNSDKEKTMEPNLLNEFDLETNIEGNDPKNRALADPEQQLPEIDVPLSATPVKNQDDIHVFSESVPKRDRDMKTTPLASSVHSEKVSQSPTNALKCDKSEILSPTKENALNPVVEFPSDQHNATKDDTIKNKANFYKPMADSGSSQVLTELCTKPGESETKHLDDKSFNQDLVDNKTTSTKPSVNTIHDTIDTSDEMKKDAIPFLTDSSDNLTTNENKDVVSEIDILQALKNEILGETLTIPGTESLTPCLHQPKITKVANVQEIVTKKKISLENYKQKSQKMAALSNENRLFETKLKEDSSLKLSRGLTAKECKRFNFPKISLGDSSDEGDKPDNLSVDDIYGDLAPKSPDDEIFSDSGNETPVIIPEEPLKNQAAISKSDVDMRTIVPKVSPQSIFIKETAVIISKSPVSQSYTNQIPRQTDPRRRNDNFNTYNDMCNSTRSLNPSGTPRPQSNYSNMTPNRYGITPIMNSNTKTFEMTPQLEIEEQSSNRKHVYAPLPVWEMNDRENYKPKETSKPRWEINEIRSSPMIRDETSSQSWEERNLRGQSMIRDDQVDRLNREKYQHRSRSERDPRLNHERRDDGYIRSECPATPSHSFGRSDYIERSECPMTPVPSFGRSDISALTPTHSFGSGDSPSVSSHGFGKEIPMTPSHPFGRSDYSVTPSHVLGRLECPSTPSHPFGRSECSLTPSHSFGRSECPTTPNHPFGRSTGYSLDPRFNRIGYPEDLNCSYSKDQKIYYNRHQSFEKHNRSYLEKNDSYPRDGREHSVGRNHNRYKHENSVNRHYINDKVYKRETSVLGMGETNNQEFDERHVLTKENSKSYLGSELYKSSGRSSTEVGLRRGSNNSRASSVSRSHTETVESQAGRSFTIDTSINRTFQEVQCSSSNVDNFFNVRRQRASSVGRNLGRDNSVCHNEVNRKAGESNVNSNARHYFQRAQSVGRDLVNARAERSFQDIKADFECYRKTSKKDIYSSKYENENSLKYLKQSELTSRERIIRTEISDVQNQQYDRSTRKSDTYSIRKNSRDPRLRRDLDTYHRRYQDRNNHNSRSLPARDRKNYGIVYTNDNIARGNILGPVKNYKIPKIKRLPEESSKKEVEDQPRQEEKETVKQDSQNYSKSKNPVDQDLTVNINTESNITDKAVNKTNTKDSSSRLHQVSPITVRRRRKAFVYDTDSDDDIKNLSKNANKTTKSNVAMQQVENVKLTETTTKEKDDTDSIDFSFEIKDEDLDLMSENIAADTVIEDINNIIAGLDKDIGVSRNNVDSIENIAKDKAFENTLDSLDCSDNQNAICAFVNSENAVSVKEAFINSEKNDNIRQDESNDKKCQESKTNTTASLVPEDVSGKTINMGGENKTLPAIDPPPPIDVHTDNRRDSSELIVSTSVDVEDRKDTTVPDVAQNNEVCSTPDSTINNDDIQIQEKQPDSTELNMDISSTHSTPEITTNDLEHANPKAELPKIDPLRSIISILKDKTKIKELMTMLDENTDHEKIKKTLAKLTEIVSDEEDEHNGNKTIEISISDQDEKPIHACNASGKPEEDDKMNIETKSQETFEEKDTKTDNVSQKLKEVQVHPEAKEKVDIADDEAKEDDLDDEPIASIKKTTRSKKTIGKKGKLKRKQVKQMENIKTKRLTRSGTTTAKQTLSKKTRLSELEKLEEDIKEMFMSNDVLNATGIRMCRLAKIFEESKSSSHLEEILPHKAKSNKNEHETTEPSPVVVLEKFGKKEIQSVISRPKKKKSATKPKLKQISVKHTDIKLTEKLNPISKYKPGPKSRTRPQEKQNQDDPYEFESDTVSEANTKASDITPFNSSDSESESHESSQSLSTDLLVEIKPKPKRKRKKWQLGVIKRSKGKKKSPKSLTIQTETQQSPEIPSRASPTLMRPDLNCFTDKSYCFSKNLTSYSCRLCLYKGHTIVHHYKQKHPHYEIPLSRMNIYTAKEAIKQSMCTNFQELSKAPVGKYVCRFCYMVFEDRRKSILEAFFWHVVSTHTGEYKQICSECLNTKKCTFMLDIPPPPKDVKGLLMGYICGKCHYTQVSLENLKNHVSLRHNDEETEVYTISLGVMSQKTVEALKKQTIQDSPRILRSLRSQKCSNSEIDDDVLTDGQSIPSSPLPRSVQSKIRFETEAISDSDITRDIISPTIKGEKDVLNARNDNVPDTAELKPGSNEMQCKASDITNNRTDKLSDESNQTTSNDVFMSPHFVTAFTETGSKEYICCVNGTINHYKTSLLISMKKHIQTKHCNESWDGFCSVCKVIVMPQGVHKFKECLTHLIDKHSENFPQLDQSVPNVHYATRVIDSEDTNEDVPTVPITTESSKSKAYINVRPISELISTPADTNTDSTATLPIIESVVSLNSKSIISPLGPLQTEPTLNETDKAITAPILQAKTKIVLKYEEVQKMIMSNKHQIVLDSMMNLEKLANVFKCAGRYCSFTSNSAESALLHASTHQKVGGIDALCCAYCSFDACGNAIDLVSHVFKEHGCCRYCCKSCFYRASTSPLVEVHYSRQHGTICQGIVLQASMVNTISGSEAEGLLSRSEAVKYYVCSNDEPKCKFRTFTPGKFCEHLIQKHPESTVYYCDECRYPAPNPTNLIQHIQSHGLKLYQCTWCVFGAESEADMLEHASIKHPTKRPQAYLRHIIETKDDSSGPKFKVLPFVHITKKNAIPPLELPTSSDSDNPVREAERALELEMLIGHTNKIIEDVETPAINENVPPNVSDLEQDDRADSGDVQATPTPVENLSLQEEPSVSNLYPPQATTPVPTEVNISEQVTPQLKKEPLDDPVTEQQNNLLPNRKVEVIYCLDSDEETSNPSVIDLSDDNDSSQGLVEKQAPNAETVRLPLAKLFKCSKCNTILKTCHGIRRHFLVCYPKGREAIPCPYCTFQSRDKSIMANHYVKEHGPLNRYVCGICKHEETLPKDMKKHFATHGITNFNFVTKDNHSQIIVEAPDPLQVRGKRKRSVGDANTSVTPTKQKRYGPDDVNSLPVNQIFDELTQCSICEFSTKVRQNMIRHLQLHGQKQSVPEIAPVNPVPHLETNEMHFDKMVNLASSSVVNRVPENQSRTHAEASVALHIPVEAAARYPKYVPERKRFACGAKGCSYISIDEEMLKCHWETLHSGSNEYHCVHCPANQQLDTSRPLVAARIIAHLKMHDVRLFSCSACPYYHHQEHILKIHISEKHGGSAQLKIVRDAVFTQPSSNPLQTVVAAPTMDLKAWQCGFCSFKSMLRPEVVDHCSKMHQSKFQFKCAFCPWRSSTYENVTKHHSNSHAGKQGDVIYFYYREGSVSNEADGTPRWMKQRQNSGIPPEPEFKKETTVESYQTRQIPQVPLLVQLSQTQSPVNLNIVKSEVVENEKEATIEDLFKKFGNFCEPSGLKYKCCLCKVVTEDDREAMQSHLFEELKYRKWGCSVCSYKAFHTKGLKEHAAHEHRQNLEPLALKVDNNVETWVTKLLEYQEKIINKNRSDSQNSKTTEPVAASAAKTSMKELEKAFGSFGAPVNMMFSCPKCDFRVKEESKMHEHLENELSKVRWCCNRCPEKFQHYHLAQIHCRTVHGGISAIVVEAIRDPKIRSSWLSAVIQVQKLSMNIMPLTSDVKDSHKDSSDAQDKESACEPDNSLLVVRYEEKVPMPEEQPARRKRPSYLNENDSDEERLVIDEHLKKADKSSLKCQFCSFTSPFKSSLHDHVLRHYDLKPYNCAYCDFNSYSKSMQKHQERVHPDKPRMTSKATIPDRPPNVLNLPPSRIVKKKPKETEDIVCLICDTITSDIETHVHPNRNPQFGKEGSIVLKCDLCSTLRTDYDGIKEHHNSNHPFSELKYTLSKLNRVVVEFYDCGNKKCQQRFQSMTDLQKHHNEAHGGTALKYTSGTCRGQFLSAPVTVDVSDDDSSDVGENKSVKRKLNSSNTPLPKRVAKKSTTKLPLKRSVAKKSTTKLPQLLFDEESYSESEEEAYSYYGTKPSSFEEYSKVTTLMPFWNTVMPMTMTRLSKIVNISPKVILEDCRSKL